MLGKIACWGIEPQTILISKRALPVCKLLTAAAQTPPRKTTVLSLNVTMVQELSFGVPRHDLPLFFRKFLNFGPEKPVLRPALTIVQEWRFGVPRHDFVAPSQTIGKNAHPNRRSGIEQFRNSTPNPPPSFRNHPLFLNVQECVWDCLVPELKI